MSEVSREDIHAERPDSVTVRPTLSELVHHTADDIVRLWLAERGLVACERELINKLLIHVGTEVGPVYDQTRDRYVLSQKKRAQSGRL